MKIFIQIMLLLMVSVSAGAENAPLEERLDDLNQKVSKVDIDQEQLEKEASHETREKVDQIMSLYRSPAYQQKLKQEQIRIREILGIAGQEKEGERIDSLKGLSGRSVYIFASSSVPLKTLRNYVAGMVAQDGYAPVMVFRGFVGGAGKIGPTVKLIGDIIKVDSGCNMASGQCDTWPVSITVDPMKFQQFDIQKVPAIALERGLKDPLILYGDVSLKYALERFDSETKEGS